MSLSFLESMEEPKMEKGRKMEEARRYVEELNRRTTTWKAMGRDRW